MYVFTKKVTVVDHLIINRHVLPLASAFCLPSVTALQSDFFFLNKLQAKMLL